MASPASPKINAVLWGGEMLRNSHLAEPMRPLAHKAGPDTVTHQNLPRDLGWRHHAHLRNDNSESSREGKSLSQGHTVDKRRRVWDMNPLASPSCDLVTNEGGMG
ncbi:unnamed protein product [Rangifer tarandus platyrhynchus]|uniref:Uncharacterized protein n=1 Tax=Rangifer tarandus platyrhynchus TaxID=3082113 RepID=A0AC59ZKA6_RANTA